MKYLFTTFLLVCLLSCDDDEETLPPATQIGANTFGCLVNGKVWLPKRGDGRPPFILIYDPLSGAGNFDLRAYNDISNSQTQYMLIFSNSISAAGIYDLKWGNNQLVTFSDNKNCYYESDDGVTDCIGKLTITKLDLAESIMSGDFFFTITKQNCETIQVTEGRFDMKL